ncbi:hypothetical protein [Microbacterium sp. 13-71-7]|jgi:hypothetical protein|uniref:hypothetical protein n=1 Tax=Microbacterium sp. 13-71-7 TaxID=1970399 RepID=UPI000BCE2194|nr:hypothetical protein [Microbacterium sp. 13-71-7]OZB79885.1 MAG: hypothetical protein B7X32_20475 [Microbacterium sp. 13-71-7]
MSEYTPTTERPMTNKRFRIWYVPQVPMKAFTREFDDLDAAKMVLNAVIDFSIFEFENDVKPDYSDAAGISRWESDGDGGFDWFDLEEDEWRDDLRDAA